jgi:hypothetical protein
MLEKHNNRYFVNVYSYIWLTCSVLYKEKNIYFYYYCIILEQIIVSVKQTVKFC